MTNSPTREQFTPPVAEVSGLRSKQKSHEFCYNINLNNLLLMTINVRLMVINV